MKKGHKPMSTIVTNEFHAKKGRGNDVLALLLTLAPESSDVTSEFLFLAVLNRPIS
jgi:hypothetical protein